MTLQQRVVIGIMTVVLGLGGLCADKLTPPPESLNGLRPGTLTVEDLRNKFGKPDVANTGGLRGREGGTEQSRGDGWFMVVHKKNLNN